jgi:hypothetical protein
MHRLLHHPDSRRLAELVSSRRQRRHSRPRLPVAPGASTGAPRHSRRPLRRRLTRPTGVERRCWRPSSPERFRAHAPSGLSSALELDSPPTGGAGGHGALADKRNRRTAYPRRPIPGTRSGKPRPTPRTSPQRSTITTPRFWSSSAPSGSMAGRCTSTGSSRRGCLASDFLRWASSRRRICSMMNGGNIGRLFLGFAVPR